MEKKLLDFKIIWHCDYIFMYLEKELEQHTHRYHIYKMQL